MARNQQNDANMASGMTWEDREQLSDKAVSIIALEFDNYGFECMPYGIEHDFGNLHDYAYEAENEGCWLIRFKPDFQATKGICNIFIEAKCTKRQGTKYFMEAHSYWACSVWDEDGKRCNGPRVLIAIHDFSKKETIVSWISDIEWPNIIFVPTGRPDSERKSIEVANLFPSATINPVSPTKGSGTPYIELSNTSFVTLADFMRTRLLPMLRWTNTA